MAKSEWAQKYGVHDTFQTRSGLTPTNPIFYDPRLINKDSHFSSLDDCLNEQYQRETLKGFSTRELVELGAITSRPMNRGNLGNDILPFLRIDNWDDGSRTYRITNTGFFPYFFPRNPQIWAMLEPILVLASRMLQESIMTPFVSYVGVSSSR